MSTYETKRLYGDFRPAVGDRVLVSAPRHDGKPGNCIHAGVVVAISASKDRPFVQDLRDGAADFDEAWPFVDLLCDEAGNPLPGARGGRRTREEQLAALADMPVRSWTWPV